MNNIKILFTQHSLRGGLGQVVVQLATSLNQFENYNIEIDGVIGIELYEKKLKESKVSITKHKIAHPLLNFFYIHKLLRSNQFDIVFTSGVTISLVYLFLLKFTGSKTKIVVRDDINVNEFLKRECSSSKAFLYRTLINYLYPHASYHIAVSSVAAVETEKLSGLKDGDVMVLNNPGWDKKFELEATKPLENLVLEKVEFIVHVGRFCKQKNQLDLVEMMPQIYQKTGLHCVFVGDGEDRFLIENAIKNFKATEYIHLVGWDTNPFRWIKNAKILALTSIYEGFGMVLVEAMGLGTQVISYNCPSGPADILKNGKLGGLVEMGNKNEFVKMLMQVLENPIPIEKLKERANDFTVEKSTTEYNKVIEHIFNND